MGNFFLIEKLRIGMQKNFLLIAGPCVIESEIMTMKIAEYLKKTCSEAKISLIFKASYDKANRTSIRSFRGPGIKQGLKILSKVKAEFRVPVLTDVHCREEVDKVAEIVDILQIPAYLCRQTDLLVAAGKTGKPVNVKKGQFLSPWDMQHIVAKIESTGNKKIMLTERGTIFGYNNLVSDLRSLVIMKKTGYPVIFDATHSVQIPGGNLNTSGGNAEYIESLSMAAVAVGIDGLFMEVHPHPEKALSDGMNSLKLDRLPHFLKILKSIIIVVRKNG
ncbi:MAG TPA: 3-deoxy-8-phosphooctulonate synthase [bacterium]